jgi:hypothetical protein
MRNEEEDSGMTESVMRLHLEISSRRFSCKPSPQPHHAPIYVLPLFSFSATSRYVTGLVFTDARTSSYPYASLYL